MNTSVLLISIFCQNYVDRANRASYMHGCVHHDCGTTSTTLYNSSRVLDHDRHQAQGPVQLQLLFTAQVR